MPADARPRPSDAATEITTGQSLARKRLLRSLRLCRQNSPGGQHNDAVALFAANKYLRAPCFRTSKNSHDPCAQPFLSKAPMLKPKVSAKADFIPKDDFAARPTLRTSSEVPGIRATGAWRGTCLPKRHFKRLLATTPDLRKSMIHNRFAAPVLEKASCPGGFPEAGAARRAPGGLQ